MTIRNQRPSSGHQVLPVVSELAVGDTFVTYEQMWLWDTAVYPGEIFVVVEIVPRIIMISRFGMLEWHSSWKRWTEFMTPANESSE